MNRVTYIGRLAQDGELSSSTNGTSFYRNTIAVSRKFKKEGEPDADFFRFKLFGKGAGTGIALIFFPGITSLILGLGKAEYTAIAE